MSYFSLHWEKGHAGNVVSEVSSRKFKFSALFLSVTRIFRVIVVKYIVYYSSKVAYIACFLFFSFFLVEYSSYTVTLFKVL